MTFMRRVVPCQERTKHQVKGQWLWWGEGVMSRHASHMLCSHTSDTSITQHYRTLQDCVMRVFVQSSMDSVNKLTSMSTKMMYNVLK